MDNHNLPNPPPRDQIVGYFNYLLDGFNLFYDAPRPVLKKRTRTRAPTAEERDSEERDAIADWVTPFRRWLDSGAANVRGRTVGRAILRLWNDQIEVSGATSLEEVFGGLDSRNRKGVIRLFTHFRSF